MISTWVKKLTEEAFGGPPFTVGDIVRHPSGLMVKIVGGQYWGEHGLSNFWQWRPILSDGQLGDIQCGYGWKQN